MRAVVIAIFWLSLLGPAAADRVLCPDDPRISVEAPASALAARVCAAVARARPPLAACHLTQARPLTVHAVAGLTHPNAACMGIYDCRDDSIAVSSPAALSELVAPGSIWARIAPEALFDSLIVHELAHAFLDQADCKGETCDADHEYIAYALQIDSLSPADRATVLEGHKLRLPIDPIRLNDFTALAAPGQFAQGAWLHFSAPGHGCAFVKKLIEGTDTLRITPE